jgi:hypothetical protein
MEEAGPQWLHRKENQEGNSAMHGGWAYHPSTGEAEAGEL